MKYKLITNTILSLAAAAAIVGCTTGTGQQRSTGQYIDDKGTAQRVRHNFSKDSLVKANKIHVESFRGNVHLTGFVDYPVQKQHAEQIARNTDGVEWVKDDIIVKTELPNNPVSQNRQINEPSGARAGTSYQNSQGSQSSQFQSSGAAAGGASAGWVRGNKGMNTELFPGEAAGAERTTSTSGSASGAQVSGTTQYNQSSAQQGELAQRVQMQLQSDTALDAQNVQVSQDGDKIILRGTVATKEQKDALEAKAKAIPGVRTVSNKIDVQK